MDFFSSLKTSVKSHGDSNSNHTGPKTIPRPTRQPDLLGGRPTQYSSPAPASIPTSQKLSASLLGLVKPSRKKPEKEEPEKEKSRPNYAFPNPPHGLGSNKPPSIPKAAPTKPLSRPLHEKPNGNQAFGPTTIPGRLPSKIATPQQGNAQAGRLKIGVFLGLNGDISQDYINLAKAAGKLFYDQKWTYVYGGNAQMGIVAKEMDRLKGSIIMVHSKVARDQMHKIADLVNAFVFLPGGFNHCQEMSAVIMWSKLDKNPPPLILLNHEKSFDHLLKEIASASAEKLPKHAAKLVSKVDSLEKLPHHLSVRIHSSPHAPRNAPSLGGDSLFLNGDSTQNPKPRATPTHTTGEAPPVAQQPARLPTTLLGSGQNPIPKLHKPTSLSTPYQPSSDPLLTQALGLADKTIQKLALTQNWSTWHAWNYVRNTTKNPLGSIWTTSAGFALSAIHLLQTDFEAAKGLKDLASKIHIMAMREKMSQSDAEEAADTSVVVIFIESSCILIDATFSPVPIKLDDGATFKTIELTTISRKSVSRTYSFSSANGLQMRKADSLQWHDLHKITPRAFEDQSMAVLKKERTTKIPTNKQIVTRRKVSKKPALIPCVPLDKTTWATEACRMQIDFKERLLTLQIPVRDWLTEFDQSNHTKIHGDASYKQINAALGHIFVKIPQQRPTKAIKDRNGKDMKVEEIKGLDVLKRAAAELGLEKAVIDQVVESMFQAYELVPLPRKGNAL